MSKERSEPPQGDVSTLGAPDSPSTSETLTARQDAPGRLRGRDYGRRYEELNVIGRGGMGEVLLCRDAVIGRDVALKVVRGSSPPSGDETSQAEQRFIREAQVQGRLEHPTVVPVYDLGHNDAGRPYFTMRRVSGFTLADVIEDLRAGKPETRERWGRRRLLTAFSQLCLAVEYAHRAGVIHRDLKPSNVMLCDFGEVYLLDWGLAKLADDAEERAATLDPISATDSNELTLQGQILGTPGYMAPEQIDGRSVDDRTDVYALGAILFEILALEPLHPRSSVQAILASTAAGVDARAHVRCPELEIPPELGELCARATAFDPEDRCASAREIHARIEEYLDGDRDLELRRTLARQHVDRARARLDESKSRAAPATEALRDLMRALALDPDNRAAKESIVEILAEPPAELPPEARGELDDSRTATKRRAMVAGLAGHVYWLLTLILAFSVLGVRSVALAAAVLGLLGLSLVLNLVTMRTDRLLHPFGRVVLLSSTIATALLTRAFGPLVFVPICVAIVLVSFSMSNRGFDRVAAIVLSCAAFIVPMTLEGLGVVPASYLATDNSVTIVPDLVAFPPDHVVPMMYVMTLLALLGLVFMVVQLNRALEAAETRIFAHGWQLRQLLPERV